MSIPSAQPQLQHKLQRRHLSMLAIAGVIGAGLFVGSGAAIQTAGPGVLVSYAAAGVIVVLVMRMLGEMAATRPETGSFSSYADLAIGRWAGFSVGWLYVWFWIIVVGIEATAGAQILGRWGPDEIPQWAWALALMIVLTLTNLASVKSFGEFEFWFASIKVAAIAVFLIFGVIAILGLMPGYDPPGLSNLTGHGGFLPNGASMIPAALLVVVLSMFGAEIATIAAGESRNPAVAVRSAVRSVVWRILVFYLGSIAIVVTLMPWDSASVRLSPYVAVMDLYGIPAAATIMDVIILTAVLSCLNSGLYTASRMLFSLSQRGEAPASWSKLGRRSVPTVTILASTVVGFLTVVLNYIAPETVFLFLANTSGAIALYVWLVISVSQLRLRRTLDAGNLAQLKVKMWAYPYLTWLTIAALLALLVGMAFIDSTRGEFFDSLALAAVVVTVGVLKYRRQPSNERTNRVDIAVSQRLWRRVLP